MKTGAKCFDIYRLPLLPGRFADASEPGRRPEGRKGRGGRGDLRWRRGSGLYFLEKGQRQRARDLERTRVNRTIQFPLLPSLDGGAPPLGLIVKNIGPSGQFESSFLLVEDTHDRVRPRTIDWIVAKERFEFTPRPLEPSPRGKLRDALAPRALFEGISNRVRNREPREPLVCEEARGKNTGTRRCR